MQHEILEHKHFIIRAEVKNTPLLQDLVFIENWMAKLIKDIGMEVLIEPQAVYCDKYNNRGVTAIAALSTSSTSLHIWDEITPAIIQFDLYSCKSFEKNTVLKAINEYGLINYEFYILDRDAQFKHIHDSGSGYTEE